MSTVIYSYLPTERVNREWNLCARRLEGDNLFDEYAKYTSMVSKNQENERQPPCDECGGTEFDHDSKSGDLICYSCGVVQQERMISDEQEWREFDDDTPEESQARVGFAYNQNIDVDLSTRNNRMRDEKEFLQQGFRDIETLLQKIFPERVNQAARFRSQQLYQTAFYRQRAEMEFDENNVRQTASATSRRRYSKRKQFVIAFVYQALKELQKNGAFRLELEKENATNVDGKKKRANKKAAKQLKPYSLER